MLVDFKTAWFGPTAVVIKDKIQHISGRRYKKGVQEVDDRLKEFLPKSAKILKETPIVKEVVESTDLKDYDQSRADGDRLATAAEEADEQYAANKQARQDRMAHARAAKGAKKGNKTNK